MTDTNPREVTFNAILYRVSFVEGGLVFMESEPIWGFAAILTVERRSALWYISDETRRVPLSTLSKMHRYLVENVAKDNESVRSLCWRSAQEKRSKADD